MSQSLWDLTAEQLLDRAASSDPTPGGGAIAAVTAAFGLSLVQMAVEVSISKAVNASSDETRLVAVRARAETLRLRLVRAVDRDVADFDALMAGYRMPRDTPQEQAARSATIDAATVTATSGPLELAEAAVTGVALGDEVEPLVTASIISDVHAGRDLLRGGAMAALRTADINLVALEARGHPDAPVLRLRRDAVRRGLTVAGV